MVRSGWYRKTSPVNRSFYVFVRRHENLGLSLDSFEFTSPANCSSIQIGLYLREWVEQSMGVQSWPLRRVVSLAGVHIGDVCVTNVFASFSAVNIFLPLT